MSTPLATAANTVTINGTPVPRIGFGALHLAGPGGWGVPADRAEAIRLVRSAVDAGIRYIDTADSLGPDVSEAIIAEALHPYAHDIVVATKAGMLRTGQNRWGVLGHPQYLKQQAHASALRLRLDTLPLFYLHRVDPAYPLEDQVGALVELREEGVIAAIGLSAVGADELARARAITPVAAVQNHYNVFSRASDDVIEATAGTGTGFVSFWSLGHGRDLLEHSAIQDIAHGIGATPAQLLIAWILDRAPHTIVLAGTSRPERLRENLGALELTLDDEARAAIDAAAAVAGPVPSFPTRPAPAH